MHPKFTNEFYEDRPELKLGGGWEKNVYADAENPKNVIGVFNKPGSAESQLNESPQLTKARFYLTKILHLFYPKNIPEISLVTSTPNAFIKKRVNILETPNESGALDHPDDDGLCHMIEEKFGIELDPYPGNWTPDKNGIINFLDTVRPWYTSRHF